MRPTKFCHAEDCIPNEAKLNDDWTIPPLTETLPEIMSEFEAKVFLKTVCADKIVGSVRATLILALAKLAGLLFPLITREKGSAPCSCIG
jgi:hypothetical protein